MTLTELEGIVDKTLPLNAGFLITGSQRHHTTFARNTDIDIVVLDVSFSAVFGFVMPHNEFRIDFTIIPFLDMENILLNEANDPKGGLLTMISTGVVIKDKSDAFPRLKQKAQELLGEIGGKTFNLYQQQVYELGQYVKYFDKALTQKQKQVLACDVVATITSVESIKSSNWVSKKHKLELFSDNSNNKVCADLIQVFTQAITGNDYSGLASFTNYYCRTSTSLPVTGVSPSTRLLIDLDYPDFSLPHFVSSVLPVVLQTDLLKDTFAYFYIAPRQQHKTYKNKIVLAFNITDHLNAASVLTALGSSFDTVFPTGYRYLVILEKNNRFNTGAFVQLEKLRIAINRFLTTAIQSDQYTPINVLHHCVLIGSYTASSMRLSQAQINGLGMFLVQRCLFTAEDQKNLSGFQQLKQLQELKLKHAAGFYEHHRAGITDYCNNGVLLSFGNEPAIRSAYSEILDAIDNLVDQEFIFEDTRNNLTYWALKQGPGDDPVKQLAYVTITQEIARYFNLADPEKIIYLTSLARAITELKGTPVQNGMTI